MSLQWPKLVCISSDFTEKYVYLPFNTTTLFCFVVGSGKTACFLIPLFEKLQSRNPTANARALILSPTRELAVQTFKFIKEIGKYMDLKTILVLGGDPISAQFSAIHACPDVIVATPGRFLHLCVEMDLKLTSIRKL